MLAVTLATVTQSLKRRRGYLLPVGAESEQIATEADSWTYAIFLAALFHGLDRWVFDQSVVLFGDRGQKIGPWIPINGPMTKPAESYKVNFGPESQKTKSMQIVVPLLAGQLVPREGLKWLWQNQQTMACWLATITGNLASAGLVAEIVGIEDKYGDSATGQERVTKSGSKDNRNSSFNDDKPYSTECKPEKAGDTYPENSTSSETPAEISDTKIRSTTVDSPSTPGHRFLIWLQSGLVDGSIKVNQEGAHVFLIEEGVLLITPGIFQDYSGLNWQKALKQFLKLALHYETGAGEHRIVMQDKSKPSAKLTGLLVPGIEKIFANRPKPAIARTLRRLESN